MSTRIFSLLVLLALTACNREAAGASPAAQAKVDVIECALHGAAAFVRECSVERAHGPNGLQLVVRHPDGGFRRFDVLNDGHGLATADGAHAAQISVRQGGIGVAVDGDRYRFPATIVSHDKH